MNWKGFHTLHLNQKDAEKFQIEFFHDPHTVFFPWSAYTAICPMILEWNKKASNNWNSFNLTANNSWRPRWDGKSRNGTLLRDIYQIFISYSTCSYALSAFHYTIQYSTHRNAFSRLQLQEQLRFSATHFRTS